MQGRSMPLQTINQLYKMLPGQVCQGPWTPTSTYCNTLLGTNCK
jgi:hypothetical protein